jgi:hypothetical protein
MKNCIYKFSLVLIITEKSFQGWRAYEKHLLETATVSISARTSNANVESFVLHKRPLTIEKSWTTP